MSEPDAWGLLDEGEVHYATPFRDEAESVLRRTEDTDSAIVPLYRSPTLTDAERTLICRLAAACEGGHPRAWTNRALTADDRATLRGLLERMK